MKIIDDENVKLEYKKLSSRRRLLLALIIDDGWTWDDLENQDYDLTNFEN